MGGMLDEQGQLGGARPPTWPGGHHHARRSGWWASPQQWALAHQRIHRRGAPSDEGPMSDVKGQAYPARRMRWLELTPRRSYGRNEDVRRHLSAS
jgi:hypothetical protein